MPTADATHEFSALNTLLLVVILGLCILSAYLIKQNSFYYLPESAAAIFVGMAIGGLAKVVYPSSEELSFLRFEPELFFFLLLPPIIFEAGYSLKKGDFFANFWTISLFAVFGTIISTFVIGYFVYWTGLLNLVSINSSSPMEALVFGSLISAVDPVATLSIMGNPELNCDTLLYSLVFGESVLNDAVSIVLFNTFMQFYASGEKFSENTIPIILFNFSIVSLGSVFVGIMTGLACSYLCKHTSLKLYPEYEISLLFLFAYGSYSFSESLKFSGIMSLFFCGIILSHYNSYNLSPTSQVTAHNIFKSLAVLSEYFVFLYIGMGIFTGTFTNFNFFFSFLCLIFCLIGRVFNIFPLSWIANIGRQTKITFPMQMVMWFAGLRGAIAFALSQNMPQEHRSLYSSTTLLLVIFTTIFCGGLTEPMLTKMGMRKLQKCESFSEDEKLRNKPERSPRSLTRRTEQQGIFSIFNRLFNRNSVKGDSVKNTTVYEQVSNEDLELEELDNDYSSLSPPSLSALYKSYIQRFDEEIMRPIFGGPKNKEQSEDDSELHFSLVEILKRSEKQEETSLD